MKESRMRANSGLLKLSLPIVFALLMLAHSAFSNARTVLQPDSLWVKHLLDSAYELEGVDGNAALRVYAEAIQTSKELGYFLGQAKALHYSGIVYSDKSMYREALDKYREALPVYRRINYTRGIGACYTNIGNVYQFLSRLDSALTNYQMALQIFRDHSHHIGLSQACGNVGGVFQKMKQYEKAYDYHTQSVRYAIQGGDSAVLCYALINQGSVLNDLGRFEESLAAHQNALSIAETADYVYGLLLANINLSDYYKQKGNYSLAIEYGLKSLDYALKLSTPYDIADVKNRLGDIYAANADFERAKVLYLESIELSESIKARELLIQAYNSLQSLSATTGDFKGAYKYLGQARQYQDSVLGEKQINILNELEVRYQSLQKDQALAQQQLQLQKSSQYTIYSIAAALIFLLSTLLFFLYYKNKRKDHQRQLKEAESEKQMQVLQALMQGEEKERVRIARGLHDEVAGLLAASKMHLNSLASSESIVLDKSFHRAVSLLDDASSSVRKTAHNLMPEMLMQYGLDEALRRYCNSVGSDKRLAIQYDSWGEVVRFPSSFELSVYRIVQELLNNIIRHANATEALVQVSYRTSSLSITVEDNGIGFPAEKTSGGGLGLTSLRTRVQALNGRMDIQSESGGVSTFLEFELTSA